MAKSPNPRIVSKKHLARLEREQRQSKIIMIAAVSVIVVVVGLIIFGILNENVFKLNRPVTVVNGQKISAKDFEAEVRFARQRMINQYEQYFQYYQMLGGDPTYTSSFQQPMAQIMSNLNDPSIIGQQTLTQLQEDAIIAQKAKELNITVEDKEIEGTLHEIFGYFPDGTPTSPSTPTSAVTSTLSPLQLTLVPFTATPTNTPEVAATAEATATATTEPTAVPTAVEETPAAGETSAPSPTVGPTATATEYTIEGYQTEVAKYSDSLKEIGYSEAQLRAFLRRSLLRDKVIKEITKDVATTADQVWARHILVADEETAKSVVERLNGGEDFAKLAAELSTDPGSKDQGGNLGWFPKDDMLTEFGDAAFSQEIGVIGQPVQTSAGWHVIQVLGHEERPLTDAQIQEAKNTAFVTWMDEQKQNSTITESSNWLDFVPSEPSIPADMLVSFPQ